MLSRLILIMREVDLERAREDKQLEAARFEDGWTRLVLLLILILLLL